METYLIKKLLALVESAGLAANTTIFPSRELPIDAISAKDCPKCIVEISPIKETKENNEETAGEVVVKLSFMDRPKATHKAEVEEIDTSTETSLRTLARKIINEFPDDLGCPELAICGFDDNRAEFETAGSSLLVLPVTISFNVLYNKSFNPE
jgi:hypothetical protein